MDPTFYSHHLLAKPLADSVTQEHGLTVTTLFADDAKKARLQESLKQNQPALVFTASHWSGRAGPNAQKTAGNQRRDMLPG